MKIEARASIVGVVALVLTLWAATPAQAIRNGTLDETSQYGSVGMVLGGFQPCTGTLISPSVVLTAAQCTFGPGLIPLESVEFSLGDGRTARSIAIRRHPAFEDAEEGFNLAFDVALIRLDRTVTSSWTDISPSVLGEGIPAPEVVLTGVGFGETATGVVSGSRRSGALLLTQYIAGVGPAGVIPDGFIEVIPADANNQMICRGDTGGPLVHLGRVVGVASFRFVAGCGEEGPGYYVTLPRTFSSLVSWIRNTALLLEDLEPPVANAGPDQTIQVGQEVILDGGASFDNNTPTGSLSYEWTLVSKPESSAASLSNANSKIASLVPDVHGDYVVSLIVRDSDGLASAPDSVRIALNALPIADAGLDQAAVVGQTVRIVGSASDPDGDPFGVNWTLIGPAGSRALLRFDETTSPEFVPDLPGTYTATMIVFDIFGGVATDEVVIVVITAEQFAETETATALNDVGALPTTSVTTQGNQQALQNLLTQALAALQAGDVAEARNKLAQAIARTDGCVLRGAPDGAGPGRDWVTDCAAQAVLYEELTAALAALGP